MKINRQKEAQKIQDDIFVKMSADKKLELASGMWLLADELKNNKNEQKNRSKRRSEGYSKNS